MIWGKVFPITVPTYSLHCSSFFGLPFRTLNIELVKPNKGTTMENIGRTLWECTGEVPPILHSLSTQAHVLFQPGQSLEMLGAP